MNLETDHSLLQDSRRIKSKFFLYASSCLVLLNLVFLVIGFTSFNKISFLHSYYLFQLDSRFVVFSIAASLLSLAVLLFFYFNATRALKDHKNRSRFFTEYLMLFLVVVLSCTYFISYRYGFALSAKNKIKSFDIVGQINCVNTSMAFLPMGFDRYEKENNFEVPTLNQEVNSWAVNQDYAWKNLKVEIEDSIRRLNNLKKRDRVLLNYYSFNPNEKRKETFHEEYQKEVKAIRNKYSQREYSYYYYRSKHIECEQTLLDEKSNKEIGLYVQDLLISENISEIKLLLKRLQENLSKANIEFSFDLEKYAIQATKDSILKIETMHTIGHIASDRPTYEYINIEDYSNFLHNSAGLKYSFNSFVWGSKNWLYVLLFGFTISFVVFTIRVNGSLGIGSSLFIATILIILIGLLSKEPIPIIILSIVLLSLVYFAYKKANLAIPKLKKIKFVNIVSYSLALLWVSIFHAISSISKPVLETFNHGTHQKAFHIVRHSEVYFLLNNNLPLLLSVYLVFLFLVLYFYYLPKTIKLKEI